MQLHRHIGVYALIRDGKRMVLIRKCRGAYTGLWDLPGGSLEFGEDPEAGLRREVLEEAGLIVRTARLSEVIAVTFDFEDARGKARLYHVGVLYDVEAEGPLKRDADGRDSEGAEWVEITREISGVSALVRRVAEGTK